ncbi:hypothetical protein HPY28_18350 [Brevibacillus sp. HB1.2]|uniref:Uncharacterized protein n=1 Tax=Brevibacillus porteri TaxID=2126350 RepID=A0ABX5FIZ6_9BACL|nr:MULTISPECIES: hypothetical protein [Brevibacillus]ATF14029.1 hypothetical protein A616_19230 [Brevibacillus brevis X23]MDC0765090.1 hypothetical protein [Brevibacillus sp. AG]MED1801746.1 hypothetical protein [Brevibacillus porteri]MED2134877.1 hypothetical protein [Brevibacillus porteri]MED2748384.1 hypothetical protein [Brevibacillus porteri]
MKKKFMSISLATLLVSSFTSNTVFAANQQAEVVVEYSNDTKWTSAVSGQHQYGRVTLISEGTGLAGAFVWKKCAGDIDYVDTQIQLGTDSSYKQDSTNVYMQGGCTYKLEVKNYSTNKAKGYIRNWD